MAMTISLSKPLVLNLVFTLFVRSIRIGLQTYGKKTIEQTIDNLGVLAGLGINSLINFCKACTLIPLYSTI
jgi:hypothetical protein